MLVVGHEFADDDEVVGHKLRVAVNEGFGFVSFVVDIGLTAVVASVFSLASMIASVFSLASMIASVFSLASMIASMFSLASMIASVFSLASMIASVFSLASMIASMFSLASMIASMFSLAIVIASLLSVPLTGAISKGALGIKVGMGEFEYLSLDKQEQGKQLLNNQILGSVLSGLSQIHPQHLQQLGLIEIKLIPLHITGAEDLLHIVPNVLDYKVFVDEFLGVFLQKRAFGRLETRLLDGLHVFQQFVLDQSLVPLSGVVVAAGLLVPVQQLAQVAQLALLRTF